MDKGSSFSARAMGIAMPLCAARSAAPALVAAFLFAFCLIWGASASAQLVFDETRVQIEGKFGEEQLQGVYHFENKGGQTVTVSEVTSGCGCTVPELEKKVYAPGEKGTLRAIFTVGQRQGEQRQTIMVKTDAGDQPLRLIVNLPVRLDIAPRILMFLPGKMEPKSATLTFAEDLPVTIENITVSDAAFSAQKGEWLKPDAQGAKPDAQVCRIDVSFIGSGSEEVRGLVQIRSKGASGKVYTDYLHLRRVP